MSTKKKTKKCFDVSLDQLQNYLNKGFKLGHPTNGQFCKGKTWIISEKTGKRLWV